MAGQQLCINNKYTVKRVYFVAWNFRDLSKIAKLNTHIFFRITYHHDFVCIEYQLFRDMICNILVELM